MELVVVKGGGKLPPFLFKMKDYKEQKINEKVFIREFNESKSGEYDWHRDHEDRTVEVLFADVGWRFQIDNQLPVLLRTGQIVRIKKNVFHRLIKGYGKLIVRLTKN